MIPNNPGLAVQIDFEDEYRINRNTPPGTVFGAILAKTGATVEFFTTSFDDGRLNKTQRVWANVNRRTGQLEIIRKPEGRLVNMGITLLSEGFTKTITVSFSFYGWKLSWNSNV